jgi:hypothetical protein
MLLTSSDLLYSVSCLANTSESVYDIFRAADTKHILTYKQMLQGSEDVTLKALASYTALQLKLRRLELLLARLGVRHYLS